MVGRLGRQTQRVLSQRQLGEVVSPAGESGGGYQKTDQRKQSRCQLPPYPSGFAAAAPSPQGGTNPSHRPPQRVLTHHRECPRTLVQPFNTVVGDQDNVLDPHSEPVGNVDTWLDRERHAGLEQPVIPFDYVGMLVNF